MTAQAWNVFIDSSGYGALLPLRDQDDAEGAHESIQLNQCQSPLYLF